MVPGSWSDFLEPAVSGQETGSERSRLPPGFTSRDGMLQTQIGFWDSGRSKRLGVPVRSRLIRLPGSFYPRSVGHSGGLTGSAEPGVAAFLLDS